MDIAARPQHPICGASDGIVAAHNQEVCEGSESAELPTPSATGTAQAVQLI